MNNLLQSRLLQKMIAGAVYYGHFGFFLTVVAAYGWFYWLPYESPRVQPINFSHAIHVGKLNLQCTYCHATVAQARLPNIPKAELCMGCHANVKVNSPEIMKLTKYYNDGDEIPWVKVHHLKSHVYFSHKRHIAAGVECAECHGQMQVAARVRQERTLKMGWCMQCHVTRNAPYDCWTCHK